MRQIVYYVATSVDGYISGPEGDISGFLSGGQGVETYQKDLLDFDTVIMGRKTYEFGYQYGLKPGQPAYGHMKHYIFSDSLVFDDPHEQVKALPRDIELVRQLREEDGTDIYLCGGGVFAGWLLEHKLIDVVKIKLNPFIQGQGVKLFEGVDQAIQLQLESSTKFEDGLQIMSYRIQYEA